MKSFGTYVPPETEGLQFHRLATPVGRTLPRAPAAGELFTLEADMPEPKVDLPWYPRGTYVFNGIAWQKLSDASRQRRSGPIGSQKIEVEVTGSAQELPKAKNGFEISVLTITPSSRKAKFSGSASFWLDHSKGGLVWFSVFRGTTLVALGAQHVDAGRACSVSITFTDLPNSTTSLSYSLKINTDTTGYLYVNQCSRFNFDGAAQTAFIVAEDN